MACCCNRNGANGNCCNERMLVQVNRVFNGGRLRMPVQESVTLSGFSPAVFTPPLIYISAAGEGTAAILTQNVTLLNDGRSRIVITYSVPITVTMRDAANVIVTANATLTRSLDVIMRLPDRPYTFEVAYAFSSNIGEVTGETAEITGCLLSVLKVLVKCEIIIRPCGCITYPDADLTEEETCMGVFARDI